MTERYYDARDGEARFRVQYPHVSGNYAVIDNEQASLVAVGHEEQALGMTEALNAAVNPEIDDVDLVIALRDVNPAHQWRVMEHLTHLVRGRIKEGFEPTIDTASLDKLGDDNAAKFIAEALMTAVYPKKVHSHLNVLGIDLLEDPNAALNMVPDEHKWRVSLTLARLYRQSLAEQK